MDDVVVTTGTSGDTSTIPDGTTFRLDDVAGKLYQVVKLDVGGDGLSSPVTSLAKEAGGNLDAILAALADPATESTLSDVLAAITALSLLVDTLEAKDYSTETTLAAVKTAVEAIQTKLNASIAVTGTFWQATQPVSAASLPLPTGAATEAELESITAAVLAVGTAIADLATVSETQPVKEVRAGTPTQSSVANATSSTSLLAANANRLGATIFNDDTASTGATLKVKLGATASTSSYTVAIAPQGYYEVPFGYTGAIDGIASAATGNARITEVSA